jgi:hypothetical protein
MTKKKQDKSNDNNKVPAGALCLGFEGPNALVEFDGEGDDKKPRMNMVIYSGGIIKNHWYWDDLVLDLAGATFPKKKYPILENHDRSLKIAYHNGPPIVDGNLRVDPGKVVFVSTPESQQFQLLSSEGFPYEASARVNPTVIERIAEGSFAEANGVKVKGPGTIFRKWEFVEGSVCVFGYDRNTQSATFSEEVDLAGCVFNEGPAAGSLANDQLQNQKEDSTIMDIKTFQEQHPDLFKQIQEEAVTGATKGVEAKFSELSQTVTQLHKTVEGQAKTITDLEGKNLKLEKESLLRSESEAQAKADREWSVRLSKSDIPDHLHKKIAQHVKHAMFIDKESGQCDWAKFIKAVDAEIKEWETDLAKQRSSVEGSSYSQRRQEGDVKIDTELDAKENEEVDKWVALVQDPDGSEK